VKTETPAIRVSEITAKTPPVLKTVSRNMERTLTLHSQVFRVTRIKVQVMKTRSLITALI